jgi:hypothetical protein
LSWRHDTKFDWCYIRESGYSVSLGLWLGHFKFPTLIAAAIGLVSYFGTRWTYRSDPYLHPGVTVTLILALSTLVPLISRQVSWDPLDTAWIPTGIQSDYNAWNGGCGT